MKTAYLFGSLNRGGTETLMLDVCQNLSKEDFDAIAFYRKGGVLEQDFIKTDVPFVHLPTSKNIFRYLHKLRKSIISNNIDIIHAQQPIDALFARLACIGTKVKIVLTFHGFDYNDNQRLIGFIIRRTDRNIFVSNYQRDYYVKKYNLNPSKQEVIYNGINFDKLKPSDNQQNISIREELKLPLSTLLFGMVGNFNTGRDPMMVCRFLKLLNEQNVDFHFIFIGKRVDNEPERYDSCVEFCQKNGLTHNVSFLGVRNDVAQILSALDAFVYATDHDTFGIAVVEAIASGTPVFVNDWAVMTEITQKGELATLYKTKDENDLLEKFVLFLQNKNSIKPKAEERARIVREQYSIRRHIENTKSLYKKLITT